jgi:LysM repeat protein
MSSIRPLITITIILAVGVFLFTKINEGPLPLPADAAIESAPLAEIPPLTTAETAPTPLAPTPSWSDPSSGTSESAPKWAEGASESVAVVPQASSLTPAPVEVPPIPELPPLAPAAESNVAATSAPPETTIPAIAPIPLPANSPVAQYPGDSATVNPNVESVTASSVVEAQTPAAMSGAATPMPPTAEAVSAVPLATSDDRYGSTQAETTAANTIPPSAAEQAPTFAFAWPEIQGALERQELVAAHEMLSRWYGNPTLTPAEAQQVELLLSQLAGTVVYSNEHRLEPPYTVHAGDTLQTIAQQYDVPWQLLAKINGIPAADMVQPGQQLKVVHGPFAAVVELDKNQLTLMLDGRYAGRFPITVAPNAGASEGQWVLEQKLVQPTTQESGVVSASYAPAAVDHVLVLRNESPAAGGATISITAGKSSPSGPTVVAPAAIRLSPRDVEEVADILSVGSPVTIRR